MFFGNLACAFKLYLWQSSMDGRSDLDGARHGARGHLVRVLLQLYLWNPAESGETFAS